MQHSNFDRNSPVLVVGLGRFGSAVALELTRAGHDVMAIEKDAALVQRYAGVLTHVVQADATDPDALEQLGVPDFHMAVVGVGTSIESSVLIAVNLVEMAVDMVWGKAITAAHGTILERIGCNRVIYPEQDAGVRTAHMLSGDILDFMELSAGYAIAQVHAPKAVTGGTLKELQVRGRFGITVVSVKSPDGEYRPATLETVVRPGDLVIIAGPTEKIEKLTKKR